MKIPGGPTLDERATALRLAIEFRKVQRTARTDDVLQSARRFQAFLSGDEAADSTDISDDSVRVLQKVMAYLGHQKQDLAALTIKNEIRVLLRRYNGKEIADEPIALTEGE